MKTRKEIAQSINEKITVINDLIDEISSLGWDIHSLFEELYPGIEYDEKVISNHNDRAIFVTAVKCGMLSGDDYSFGSLEMLDDENELAGWQWRRILEEHFKKCEAFWYNDMSKKIGLSEEECYYMAYLDLLRCKSNPFSPNGQIIPDQIKKEFDTKNHLMKLGKKCGPIRLEVVERAIEAGFGGWKEYKKEHYPNN